MKTGVAGSWAAGSWAAGSSGGIQMLPSPELKGLSSLVPRNIRIKTLLRANLSPSSGSPSWSDCPQVQHPASQGHQPDPKTRMCAGSSKPQKDVLCLRSISHSLTKHPWPDSLVAKRRGVTGKAVISPPRPSQRHQCT